MTCSRACLQGNLPAGVTSSRRGSDCGMDGADRALATGGSSPPASQPAGAGCRTPLPEAWELAREGGPIFPLTRIHRRTPMDGVRTAAGWVRELQGRWLGSLG